MSVIPSLAEAKQSSSPENSSTTTCTTPLAISSTPPTKPSADKDSPSPPPSNVATATGVKAKPAKRVKLEWFAGFVDGEGNFAISRDQLRSGNACFWGRLMVTNTDRPTLERIQATFGGNIYRHNAKLEREHTTWKTSWRWQLTGDDAGDLAAKLAPLLVTKRRHAELFVTFFEHKRRRGLRANPRTLARYKQRLHALNRRGKHPNTPRGLK